MQKNMVLRDSRNWNFFVGDGGRIRWGWFLSFFFLGGGRDGFFELFNQICWFVLASIMYCTYSKLVNFLWVEVYRSYGVLVHLCTCGLFQDFRMGPVMIF